MAMNPIKYYVADAFTDSAFKGNPAAVCLLNEDRDDKWLQAVANEFNISATCFVTPITHPETASNSNTGTLIPKFRLRWFSPHTELKLCGHGTLATANVLFTSPDLAKSNVVEFVTQLGIVVAKRVLESSIAEAEASNCQKSKGQQSLSIELDFPVVPYVELDVETSLISQALGGARIIDIKKTTTRDDLMVILPSSKAVEEVKPNFDALKRCPERGMIISGVAPPESGFDFYTRVFIHKFGMYEDPVCGSAHCALAPYWSKKLQKHDFVAYMASQRGGVLKVHLDEQSQRVLLRGKAITVMEGFLFH